MQQLIFLQKHSVASQVGTLQQPRTGWTLLGGIRSSPRMFGHGSQMPLAELWPLKEPGAAVGPLP